MSFFVCPCCAGQILFCSRTHSQLAQFLQELRKSPLSAGVRVATIASRSLLCVNDEVRVVVESATAFIQCSPVVLTRYLR